MADLPPEGLIMQQAAAQLAESHEFRLALNSPMTWDPALTEPLMSLLKDQKSVAAMVRQLSQPEKSNDLPGYLERLAAVSCLKVRTDAAIPKRLSTSEPSVDTPLQGPGLSGFRRAQ